MKCWVCTRQSRGFGHTDLRYGIGDPRRYPRNWVFCSSRCQNVFHMRYGHWQSVLERGVDIREVTMIDPSDVERAAMRQCLKPFGEVVFTIGFTKPLGAYSEAEALAVIEAIVTRWTEAMLTHHDMSQYPLIPGMSVVPDPMGGLEEDGLLEGKGAKP